jgi:lipid II:glycine glycyltransferase (peptidoglycan interpeptide bridge formation enzyme)
MELITFALSNADAWDMLVLKSENYSVFHSMAWARVLSETYSFTPLYLGIREKEEFAAVPLMVVQKPFLGKNAVCLPFCDSCVPVFSCTRMLELLVPAVLSLVKERRWRVLEFRGDCGIPLLTPHERFYEHVISLGSDAGAMLSSFRPSTKRNIMHAEREGVRVELDESAEAIDAFYELHCLTRRRHGVPPQPKAFFKSIHRNVIEPENGFIARAQFRGKTIASSIFIHFGKRALYKFGASQPDNEHLRPNNLIIWSAIKWYASRGFDSLSLGRTSPADSGLMQFKNGWGARSKEILYCRWPPRGGALQPASNPIRSRLIISVTRRLPIPFLKLAGALAYKFFG